MKLLPTPSLRPQESHSARTRMLATMPLMLLLGALTVRPAVAEPLFAPALPYEVGLYPESAVTADFDGDGNPDLATANNGSNPLYDGSVSVLLGNGDGTFAPKTDYATDPYPRSIAVGDLNRDGKLDLITASFQQFIQNPDGSVRVLGRVVSVLLGNGDGTFGPKITTEAGNKSQSMVIGDLNADGKLDLVLADGDDAPGFLSVMLGNGDGTFGPPSRRSFYYPAALAIGDLNRDGKLDLVVGGAGVSVLLGNEDGTFGSATAFVEQEAFSSVAIGDLNRDGKPDVAAVISPGSVAVLLGNGDGTLVTSASQATGSQYVFSVSIGDLNGDGRSDLAVGNANEAVSVLLGNGDGTLGPSTDYGSGPGPTSVVIGDFNRDGKPDLAATSNFSGHASKTVSVLLNIGPDPIRVDFHFHPQTVHLSHDRNWVTGTLQVPSPYDASQVDVSSIRLNGVVAVATGAPHEIDIDHGKRSVLNVRFSWAEVEGTLEPGQRVPVTVTGTIDGRGFNGTDTIRVIGPVQPHLESGEVLVAGVPEGAPEPAVSGAFAIARAAPEVEGGAAAFALRPTNPTTGALTVRLSLASSAPAILDAFDVSGRKVASREVGGPGWQAVKLGDLPTGLYTVRLSQAGRSLTSHVAIIR